jgi:hypothetical protein
MDVHQAEIKILSAGDLMTVAGDRVLVRLERRGLYLGRGCVLYLNHGQH